MPRKRGRRIAAIDIGTNSIHMIVAENRGAGFDVIDKEKEMVQLGRGSLGGSPLTEESMARAVEAIGKMAGIARQLRIDEIRAVATSAVREAPNRQEFLSRVHATCGVDVEIVSGEEEADIIFRAVRASVDFQGGAALSIDIGGGSVELVVGTLDEVFFTASEPVGALRMSQRFFVDGPIDATAIAVCRRHVRRTMKRALSEIRALDFALVAGTSGTILTLAQIANQNGRPRRQGGVRRREVLALADRRGVDRNHANHVARLSLRIFDQTAGRHRLGAPERELLEYAALLHEIGVHVSFRGHHRHTYYLIRHAGLAGFTGDQIAVLANVARYHRKARPRRTDGNFAELDRGQRKVVRRLAAMLRFAVSLDRSRHQAIRDVEIHENGKLRLVLSTRNGAAIDFDDARRGSRELARALGRKVIIETSRRERHDEA